jgi:GNAT superfamily N-acetyltransferase
MTWLSAFRRALCCDPQVDYSSHEELSLDDECVNIINEHLRREFDVSFDAITARYSAVWKIATVNGVLVGTAQLTGAQHRNALCNVAVRKSHRGAGIASHLLQMVKAECPDPNILNCDSTLLSFYRKRLPLAHIQLTTQHIAPHYKRVYTDGAATRVRSVYSYRGKDGSKV